MDVPRLEQPLRHHNCDHGREDGCTCRTRLNFHHRLGVVSEGDGRLKRIPVERYTQRAACQNCLLRLKLNLMRNEQWENKERAKYLLYWNA
jgi:hypothetical protein